MENIVSASLETCSPDSDVLPWRLKAVVRVDQESADLLKQPLCRTDVGQMFPDHEIEKEAVYPGKAPECDCVKSYQ